MERIKEVGQIVILSHEIVIWRIPNFYDLPQIYDTIFRSPRFKNNDRDWYMEVYPNGRRLYSSLGWFGISVLNLNSESCVRNACIGVLSTGNMIATQEESHGDGFYFCTRFIPISLLNFWKDIFAPEGNLCLAFHIIDNEDKYSIDMMYFKLRVDHVQEWFQNNFENVSEAPIETEEQKEFPMETTVGELDVDSTEVKWIIPNFSDILHSYDTVIRSPRFHKKDSDWYMEVYPNGRSLYSSLGWFGIAVCNLNSDTTSRCTAFTVHEVNYEIEVKFKADSQKKGFSCSKLLPTSLLKSWQDVIAPGDKLNLVFLFDEDDDEEDGLVNRFRITMSKESMQRWYKQKFENADTSKQASTQTEEGTVRKLYNQKFEAADTFIEASTQTEEEIVKEDLKETDSGTSTEKSKETEKGLEKMRQDLQEIFLKENITDIVLKVNSHEYKAHRCILAARSPVFLAMMTHDTKEKRTGVVDIPDGVPNIFPDFLKYLYTGSVSNLTSENAVNLYTMADKYQVSELKESCKNLMMATISIDNFCDVFTLSLQHDEKELKDACIQFFAKSSLDIIVTCKWQTFLSENPITGNELFIKHLQLNK